MIERRRWLAFGLTLVVAALWYAPDLLRAVHPADESAYFQGFALALGGESPYGAPRFVYLPVFARGGALAVDYFGERATTLLLRLVNLVGACVLVRQSVAITALGERTKTWLGLAAIVGFRPFLQSFGLGNLSPLAAAATLVGLVLVGRRPIAAGLVLAAGCAVKPAGVGALAVLLAYGTGAGARNARLAAATAIGAIAAILTVDARWLGELLSRSSEPSYASTNLSLQGIVAGLGVHVPLSAVAALVLLACAAWIRARRSDWWALVAIGCVASLYWVPRVWVHSFVMIVPAVVMAIAEAAARVESAFFPSAGPPASTGAVAASSSDKLLPDAKSRAIATAAWVLLGLACIAVGDAWGELGSQAMSLPFLHSVGAAVPLLATVLLTRATCIHRPPASCNPSRLGPP